MSANESPSVWTKQARTTVESVIFNSTRLSLTESIDLAREIEAALVKLVREK